MRTYLSILPSICGMIFSAIMAATAGAAHAWEVLEGCRLLNAPINDGDSFLVEHQEQTFIVRLYFVDCPETLDTYGDRIRDQARYFSISETSVLAAGKRASAYTRKFLRGDFTVITQWADARGGQQSRYFALVRKEGQMLSTELVRNGLARIYGMPTYNSWPDGLAPHQYLGQLKQFERKAQRNAIGIWADAAGSPQLTGLQQLEVGLEGSVNSRSVTQATPTTITTQNGASKLILNTASAAELDTLPGIGPALAAAIIDARPIQAVDDLAAIPGITLAKIDQFRTQVLTDAPAPPPNTAAFYLADHHNYLNRTISVQVSSVAKSTLSAPESFRAVQLQTAYQDEPGGSIAAFIPEELYATFIQYYQTSGRSFTGLLVQHGSQIVLLHRRR